MTEPHVMDALRGKRSELASSHCINYQIWKSQVPERGT